MGDLLPDVGTAYRQHVVTGGRETRFLVLLAFVLTFLVVHSVTHLIRATEGRRIGNVVVRGVHVHHLVPGIVLLLISGYLSVTGWRHAAPLALGFGVGAALTLDEFALWLHLEDVYWTDRGRRSVHVVIGTVGVLLLLLLHLGFWSGFGRAVERLAGIV